MHYTSEITVSFINRVHVLQIHEILDEEPRKHSWVLNVPGPIVFTAISTKKPVPREIREDFGTVFG